MARPLRLDPFQGIHHVFTRGTKRWIIFHDDADRRRFLGVLTLVCDRYDVEVLAYCLMDNHFHLVLQCPEGGLSAALRDLKSIYARGFNERHRSSGPIFEDRFGSKLVTSHRQLRQLVRYVHRNPLAIDPAMDLSTYPWSSHGVYTTSRPCPTWLHIEHALALFGDYRTEVERPVEVDEIQNRTVAVSGTATVPAARTERYSLSAIRTAVAHAAGRNIAEVSAGARNGLVGVALVVALEEGHSFNEVFEPFGYHNVRAAQRAAQRTRHRLGEAGKAADILRSARARLERRAA